MEHILFNCKNALLEIKNLENRLELALGFTYDKNIIQKTRYRLQEWFLDQRDMI